jgi:uncharacterized protein YkuJ
VQLKQLEEFVDVVHLVVVMTFLLEVVEVERPEKRERNVEAELIEVDYFVENEQCVVEVVIRRLVNGLCYQMNL